MSDEAEPKYYPVRLVWTGGKSGDLTVEGKVVIKTGVPSGGPDEAMFHSPPAATRLARIYLQLEQSYVLYWNTSDY